MILKDWLDDNFRETARIYIPENLNVADTDIYLEVSEMYVYIIQEYICPSSGSCESDRRFRPKSWVVDFLPSTGRTFKACIFCFL